MSDDGSAAGTGGSDASTGEPDAETGQSDARATGSTRTDRPEIRALDQRTIERIAAGEVVERPASVVKELVENSLDADASRVAVAVESGGIDGVTVRDDGVGMDRTSVELAVEAHTTSKIRDSDDLDGGVGTLGFRGEALHTIGAVSRLTVKTRGRGDDGAGTELRLEGGEVTSVGPVGCPEGTTVEVADLFYNTPARAKFLKTRATEFDHVNTVVTHYALANPDVAVSLTHDGREVFATEGRGSLEATVLSVYGREVAESMVRVDVEPDGDGVHSITGVVSHPEKTRSARDYLSTFVNGRYVAASGIKNAVLDAYGGQIAPDRYPFAVLFLSVPPESVDVNVHPRKMEVRFDEERRIADAVERAVEEALLSAGLVRSSAPRGRSAPDETVVSPERVEDPAGGDERGGRGGGGDGRGRTNDGRRVNDDGRGGAGDDRDDPASTAARSNESTPPTDARTARSTDAEATEATDGSVAGEASDGGEAGDAAAWDAADAWSISSGSDGPSRPTTDLGVSSTRASGGSSDPSADPGSIASSASTETDESPSDDRATADERPADGSGGASDGASPDRPGVFGSFRAPTEQRTLDGDRARLDPAFDRLPSMRVFGQAFDTYLVAETADGLVLIDQHAADERVNYERLRREVADGVPAQTLAEGVDLELTAREAALFEEYADALAGIGFRAERVDERTVVVESVPTVVDSALDPGLLRDALTAFVRDEADGRDTVDEVVDGLLADLACYPSLTGNTSLHEGSVLELLEALDGCENPYACPHGRPVIIEVDRDEIDARFERDYPGHAGRRED